MTRLACFTLDFSALRSVFFSPDLSGLRSSRCGPLPPGKCRARPPSVRGEAAAGVDAGVRESPAPDQIAMPGSPPIAETVRGRGSGLPLVGLDAQLRRR